MSLSIEFFRYCIVGGFAFLIDFGLLYVATEFLKIHYLISAALAFTCGLLTNYFLSIRWVFAVRAVSNQWAEVGLFTMVGIVGLSLNEFIIWFFTERMRFHYLASKLFSAGIVLVWNFAGRKTLLFRSQPNSEKSE